MRVVVRQGFYCNVIFIGRCTYHIIKKERKNNDKNGTVVVSITALHAGEGYGKGKKEGMRKRGSGRNGKDGTEGEGYERRGR